MNKSENFGFNLPNVGSGELADVRVLNENFENADRILKNQQDKNDKNSSELEKQKENIERISSEVQRQSEEISKRVEGEKTSVVDENSADNQIPTAKAVFDATKNVKIDVDDKFSSKSENPVQNKIISANVASAIKCTASGEAVRLDDVSPLEHEIGVKLSGVTLIPLYTDDSILNSLKSEGDFVVSAVEQTGDTYRISFGGEYYVKFTDTFGNGNKVQVGDVIYNDSSGDNTGNGWLKQKITDYSNVTLTKYGKNFIDIKNPSYKLNAIYEVDSGGVATLTRGNLATGVSQTYASRAYWNFGNYDDFVGKTFVISLEVVEKSVASNDLLRVFADFNTQTEANISTIGFSTVGKKTLSFTVPENTGGWKKIGLYFYCQSLGTTTVTGEYIKFKDLQMEVGNTPTEYEEYKEPITYTPKADGTVKGIVGNGECITLMTDTEGVTIEAEYNADTKKYIDKKFAELAATILNS